MGGGEEVKQCDVMYICVVVMEVACGEYGDNVPKLVVATKTGKCNQFQNIHKKLVNCTKTDKLLSSAKELDITSLKDLEDEQYPQPHFNNRDPFDDINLSNLNLDTKETFDDNLSDGEYGSNGQPVTVAKVTVNLQNGACDTMLLKQQQMQPQQQQKEKEVSVAMENIVLIV